MTNLRKHRKIQSKRRLRLGAAWSDLDLVCDRGDGAPLDPDAFSKAFRRFTEKAGLSPRLRLHDARHGVASLLFRERVHPAVVSAILGHSSTAFTMDVYTHHLDALTGDAAEAIDRAFGEFA